MLESKVQKAVAMLGSLQEENSLLKSRLGEYETRIDELEFLIEEFKEEQTEIEQGIISALNKLDSLESATRQAQAPRTIELAQVPTDEPTTEPVIEPAPTQEQGGYEPEPGSESKPVTAEEPITDPEPEAIDKTDEQAEEIKTDTIELDIF